MDMFVFNGAALNGSAGVSVVQAAANVSITTGFAAGATRTVNPSANIECGASFTALQTKTHAAAAQGDCTGLLAVTPTHQQAGESAFDAGADLTGYVLRTVGAEAGFIGNGSFVPIPASLSAAANIVAGATLSASGTPVIAAAAVAVAGASASVSSAAYVNRGVKAALSGAGTLRVESGVNGTYDAYVSALGTGVLALPDKGALFANAATEVAPSCALEPVATTIQAAAAAFAAGADVTAVPTSTVVVAVQISGSADCGAGATRVVQPRADAVAACILSAKMYQQHAGAADNVGGVSAQVIPLLTQNAEASFATPNAVFVAKGTANRMASVNASGNASATAAPTIIFGANTPNASIGDTVTFLADAAILRFGQSDWAGGADLVTDPLVTKYSAAAFAGGADATADGLISSMAVAVISGGAEFEAVTIRMQLGEAVFDGAADMALQARLNAEALDPPERTVRRPATMRELRRPFIDRTMRKAA